jgi:hypothetical protein
LQLVEGCLLPDEHVALRDNQGLEAGDLVMQVSTVGWLTNVIGGRPCCG